MNQIKRIFPFLLFSSLFTINYSLPFFNDNIRNENATNGKTTYIFGHKSPDTDTIASSIALADYLKKAGNQNEIIPCRLGELNKETKYVLKAFVADTPLLLTNLSETDEVILVDHNDPSQTLDPENSNVVGLIDHHALTGLITSNPIKIISNPIGCTSTIIYELFKENNISISNQTAGLMLSAIISDTILLKSKTTTNEDIDAFNYLTEFTGINSTKYGLEMLIAGTNVSDYSEYDIITVDSKAYTVNGYPIQIANVNSANVSEITERKTKLLEEIDKYIKDNNKELFVLTIVDIINMDSTIFVKGNLSNVVETAFNVTLKDNEAFLKGITSRKKEVYPPISKVINELPENKDNPSYSSSSSSSSSNNSSNSNNSIPDENFIDVRTNSSKEIKLNYLIYLVLLLLF